MSLMVPPVTSLITQAYQSYGMARQVLQPAATTNTAPVTSDLFIDVQFDVGRQELIFDSSQASSPVRVGEWVLLNVVGKLWHCWTVFQKVLC